RQPMVLDFAVRPGEQAAATGDPESSARVLTEVVHPDFIERGAVSDERRLESDAVELIEAGLGSQPEGALRRLDDDCDGALRKAGGMYRPARGPPGCRMAYRVVCGWC